MCTSALRNCIKNAYKVVVHVQDGTSSYLCFVSILEVRVSVCLMLYFPIQ